MAWNHLYTISSFEFGTLAFFRSRLHRIAVGSDPKKCVDATTEFFLTVVNEYWLACACDILGISELDDSVPLPSDIQTCTPLQKLAYVRGIAQKVVG